MKIWHRPLGAALLLVTTTAAFAPANASSRLAVPTCHGKPATIAGTNGDDHLVGTRKRDVIVGKGGSDTIEGRGGRDLICGSDGNDILKGGRGRDVVVGGKGWDKLFSGKGDDLVLAGVGSDHLVGGPGHDRLLGQRDGCIKNPDERWCRGDTSIGGPGNDVFDAAGHPRLRDTLDYSGEEHGIIANLVKGTVRRDIACCVGNWTDQLGQGGSYRIIGSSLDDVIVGSDRDETIIAGPGDDELKGRGGHDVIKDGLGNDLVNGGEGDDRITSGPLETFPGDPRPDDDTVYGGDGADQIRSLQGNNAVYAGAGNDRLYLFSRDGDPATIEQGFGGPGDDVLGVYPDVRNVYGGGIGNDRIEFLGTNGIVLDMASEQLSQPVAASVRAFEIVTGSETNPNTIYGTESADAITTGNDADTVIARGGDDTIQTWGGADHIDGGDGTDIADAGADVDTCVDVEQPTRCESVS